MKNKLGINIFWYVCLLVSILGAAFCGWIFFGSFQTVKPVLDALASDRNLESFTLDVYEQIKPVAAGIGSAAGLIAVFLAIFPKRSRMLISSTFKWLKGVKQLPEDFREFFRDLKINLPEKSDLIALGCLILVGAALRAVLANMPMGHDESYTVVVFANRDMSRILQDYHLPNNHVFHSILVHFSIRLFGTQPWAVRLPAALSVLGMIPTGYLIGRKTFNRKVALLIGASIAIMPSFILSSVNARGYPLVALFFLLVWLLGIYLRRRNNLFGWLLFILFSVLGLFTNLSMLYGLAIVMVWMLVSWLLSDITAAGERAIFLRNLILAGLAVVLLTVLAYTPILINNGITALLGPPVINQLKVKTLNLLSEDFFARVGSAWREWHTGFSPWFRYAALFGVGWAFLRYWKISRQRMSPFLVGAVVIPVLLIIQMTVGWMRIWFFLSPIYFLYAFAGWVDIIDLLTGLVRLQRFRWVSAGLVMLVVFAGSAGWWIDDSSYRELMGGSKGPDQMVAEFIAEVGKESDLIATTSPDAPIVWYYAGNLGIKLNRFNTNSGLSFTHALLVVNTAMGQTPLELLNSKGVSAPSIDQIEQVYRAGPLKVYYTPIRQNSP